MKNVLMTTLMLSRLSVPEKIQKARHIVTSMTANAKSFLNPVPALADVSAAATTLELAYDQSLKGAVDATAEMHESELLLDSYLRGLAAHVQMIASQNQENGKSIILKAGLNLKSPRSNGSTAFRGENTGIPGQVRLRTKYINRASFLWEYLVVGDPNAQWTESAKTVQASVYISGLKSEKRYQFRVASVTKDGQGQWSDAITLLVL